MGHTPLPWCSCIIRLPGPAPRPHALGWTNAVQAPRGSGDSIFCRNRSPTDPSYLDPRTIRGFDRLKGVTLHSWPMVNIPGRIGETEKRHSLDGSQRPRLRGNRQRQHAQACTRRTKLLEDHFGSPLCRQGSQTVSHELRPGASGTALSCRLGLGSMQF